MLPRRPRIAVLGACAALLLTACTTRRVLEIDTNPSGARIWVNGVLQDQPTPVEIEFVHAGWFTVRVEKRGYLSVARDLEVNEGVEGWPIIDLFFEATTRERRYQRMIDLQPVKPDPGDPYAIARRREAEAFRARTYREAGEARPPERILPSTEIMP